VGRGILWCWMVRGWCTRGDEGMMEFPRHSLQASEHRPPHRPIQPNSENRVVFHCENERRRLHTTGRRYPPARVTKKVTIDTHFTDLNAFLDDFLSMERNR